ncbi:MAG: cyclic nucleotide-binding domain-containing protein [Candidatus Ozemobacteraceae bacterium]
MLATFKIFSGIPPEILSRVETVCQTVELSTGEYVFHQGNKGDEFYLILRGQVEVAAKGNIQLQRTVAILRTGDFFGEMAILNKTPVRTASALASAPTTLIILPATEFERLLDQHPCFARAILSTLSRRLEETTSQTFMIDIWRVIAAEPNVARLLQAAVHTAEAALECKGSILLEDDAWSKLEYKFAAPEEISLLHYLRDTLGTPVIGIVTADNVKLKVDKPKAVSAGDLRMMPPEPLNMELPILVEGRKLGTFHLYGKTQGFKSEDNEFLRAFTEQLSSAIELELLRGRLQRMETRVNGIFEAIADGILVLSDTGEPVMSNRAFKDMFYPAENPNGSLAALLPSFMHPGKEHGLQELVLLKPHEQIISSHYVTTRNPDGNHQETILSLRNITALKRDEQKFLQLIAMLIRRISKLFMPMKSCEEKSRKRRYERVKRMVKNLTSLTEIKSGPLRVQRMPVSIREFLAEVDEKIAPLFKRKRLKITSIRSPIIANSQFLADSDLLRDAFIALLAFHGRRLGFGASLTIREAIDGDQFNYTLETSNDAWRAGPNAEMLDWQKCVEWFISEEGKAFLLELAFARHIVESHKGKLDYHEVVIPLKNPEHGTSAEMNVSPSSPTVIFTVRLPLES